MQRFKEQKLTLGWDNYLNELRAAHATIDRLRDEVKSIPSVGQKVIAFFSNRWTYACVSKCN